MKLAKIKSIFLALSAALVLAALCLITALSGVKAYAEDGISFNEYEGKSFIYSAEFTPADGAKEAALVFGASKDAYFTAAVDIEDGIIKLSHSEDGELKSVPAAPHSFKAGKQFKITLVVNDGTAKIFIDKDDVAMVCCKLDNYEGGRLGLKSGGFGVNNVSFTDIDLPEGDIYCSGFEVLKVVNITDGNRKLSSGEYTVEGGLLKVSREYLKTLESNTEYTFRAVTSFTDFDFKINTDFTAVTVTPAVEKYYRDSDVTLELSENVKVHKLLIDGKECKFDKTADNTIKIPSKEIGALSTGSHRVKLYTDKGRPETSITVSEIVETVTEPAVKASHVFLWVDLAIFLSAIVGYTAFSIYSKRKKK